MHGEQPFAWIAASYPRDLARRVEEGWPIADGLPARGLLAALLSVCYQASLLHEEGRPVRFRLLVGTPDALPLDGGPPDGLHVLELERAEPFTPASLRRMVPALDFERALLAVDLDQGAPRVWGILVSGERWLDVVRGGRRARSLLPRSLAIAVNGPGQLTISCGEEVVASLHEGVLGGAPVDVFASRWLPASFAAVRADVLAQHEAARANAGEHWARLDPDFLRVIAQQMVRRMVSTVRAARHGASILLVPAERADEVVRRGLVRFRHSFADGEPRRRFGTLVLRIMNRLAELHGGDGRQGTVGWSEYKASTDADLAVLDEALFEFAHLVAALAAVDGALVLTKRFEVLGFGAEISGDLPDVEEVRRALDLDGDVGAPDPVTAVGIRHRSGYRFCAAVRDAVAIVVSQDGNARFMKWLDGAVTYWDQEIAS